MELARQYYAIIGCIMLIIPNSCFTIGQNLFFFICKLFIVPIKNDVILEYVIVQLKYWYAIGKLVCVSVYYWPMTFVLYDVIFYKHYKCFLYLSISLSICILAHKKSSASSLMQTHNSCTHLGSSHLIL